MKRRFILMLGVLLAGMGAVGYAATPVYIGLDAEFGHKTSTSAQAIQRGIEVAIEEVNQAGGVLGGRPLELVTKDNRSITAVGLDNLRELAKMPDLVAVFGGKFSPIYIESLPLVHELGLPLMDPWGSADKITDHQFQPSYTFRLSLKDEWAGPAFVRFAKDKYKASKLGILLPNTAWGRSNKDALEKAAAGAKVSLAGHRWYNWGDKSLLASYQELRAEGAQAIVLVANETEGSILVKEVAALPKEQRLPIVSHWGVTGGDFARMCGDALDQVDFSVIQTYSFIGKKSETAKRVVQSLSRKYGVASAENIVSPVGVAHAYDLTHLLVRAIQKAGSTDRAKVRDAMQKLGPYKGLIQNYPVPFTAKRHDALSRQNIFFARYTPDDQLIPVDSNAVAPAAKGK